MLRKVDISSEQPLAEHPCGAEPKLDWVCLADMRIDDRYQRPLSVNNWRAIRGIAAAFDWSMFTPVIVSQIVGGGFAVIDGQHRIHAAALVGIEKVPAMIVDVPPSLQAAAFAAVNSQRVTMTPFHILKAELAAGDKVALACDRAVSDGGCKLMTYNASAANKRPREIYSIAEIKTQVRAGRDKMVARALKAISGSDRSNQIDMYRHKVLRAWFAALAAEPGFLSLDLEKFVSGNDLSKVVDRVGYMRDNPEFSKLSDFALSVKSFRALIRQSARSGEIGIAK